MSGGDVRGGDVRGGAGTPAARRTASRRRVPLTLAAGTVSVAAATAAGLWFAPFVLGVFLGAFGVVRAHRARTASWCAAVAAVLGWAVLLVVRAVAGEAVVATARVAGAMTGLPADGRLFILVTLLIAAVQAVLGAWLGRSVTSQIMPRPRPPATVMIADDAARDSEGRGHEISDR